MSIMNKQLVTMAIVMAFITQSCGAALLFAAKL